MATAAIPAAITATDVLRDAFGRVHEAIPSVVIDLTPDELLWRPDPDANHVAWLVWHLARVQDDHLAGLAGVEQVWTSGGWAERFGLPYDTDALGYGQSAEEVGAFRLEDPALLTGYHAATHELTESVLDGFDARDEASLAEVVDRRWDPPVTAAVRLVSVVNDTTQHLGQAAYLRGLLERRRS
ncbi:MAG: hypothetical protein AVDCRST_MAG47-106 [uncultured Nocardioidaceae bacterium]|uniref:DinB-like domain-containing protein n=1 Tax=uncultured Nocardioidaceae bacterium TaxID=253824 RepID=A0A6J4MK25_9ACTN|nr:MAG: hypothetical protein AVDCRST_MAG47-106 [uncultured Nocardioidaceae bacterium]